MNRPSSYHRPDLGVKDAIEYSLLSASVAWGVPYDAFLQSTLPHPSRGRGVAAVLACEGFGVTYRQAAAYLRITHQTISYHRSMITRRLHADAARRSECDQVSPRSFESSLARLVDRIRLDLRGGDEVAMKIRSEFFRNLLTIALEVQGPLLASLNKIG